MSDQKLRLTVTIRVEQPNMGGGLNISEDCYLDNLQFLEIAKILGQFHDLIEAIKTSQSGGKP